MDFLCEFNGKKANWLLKCMELKENEEDQGGL